MACSLSVHRVAPDGRRSQISLNFEIQQSVMATPSCSEAKLKRMHNNKPCLYTRVSKPFLNSKNLMEIPRPRPLYLTRHRASTSMYSLTFCVRFLLPERHQRKPAVQAAAVMLRTPPSTANHRRASHVHFPYTARNFENAPRHPPVSGQQRVQTPPSRPFALCRHVAGWTQACN